MRTALIFSVLGATLISAGVPTVHAADRVYYDPSNAASPTGKTVGHELFGTIGCPGKGLLEAPCPKLAPTPAPAPAPTPAPTPAPAPAPAPVDSDGDGIVDGVDKCPTVHAKTADGCPVAAAPKTLVLEGVNFGNNQASLQQDSFATLDAAAASLKEWGDIKVEVAGHTDSVGKDSYNLKLSQSRAEAVRNYLIDKGVAAARLTARGYGEARPVADNATEAGRYKNRRVELVPMRQ